VVIAERFPGWNHPGNGDSAGGISGSIDVFLALGAWRISQHHVLTRRVPAVEMAGSCDSVVRGQNRTLTLNRMTVTQIGIGHEQFSVDGKQLTLPERLHEVVEYSILAALQTHSIQWKKP